MIKGKNPGVPIPDGCVIFSKLFIFSRPQFSHLYSGVKLLHLVVEGMGGVNVSMSLMVYK